MSYRFTVINAYWAFMKESGSESEVLKIEESESAVLKIEESESELLCTDSKALLAARCHAETSHSKFKTFINIFIYNYSSNNIYKILYSKHSYTKILSNKILRIISMAST
jgi:hypothetical protein